MTEKIIDTNVYLGRWPFRRVYGDEPTELVSKLREQGVVQAWTGAFDSLLHRDVAAVNARLAKECHSHGEGLLVPFGATNPPQARAGAASNPSIITTMVPVAAMAARRFFPAMRSGVKPRRFRPSLFTP